MIARSLERQCGASAARAAMREDFLPPTGGFMIRGTTQLMRAVLLNNLPRVRQLAQLGAPLELKDKSDGFSALHWACSRGHEHVTQALLDGKYERCGAEADARNNGGRTPLMVASQSGHEGVVRLLLKHGARQELQDEYGYTSLYRAVINNRASIVSLLCASRGVAAALALRTCGVEYTPLMIASSSGDEGVVHLLLAQGSRQELQDASGLTALHHAVDEDHPGIVAMLCSATGAVAALALRCDEERSPLGHAIERGHAACEAVLRAHSAPL
jgi:ankyrin repeat protein